MYLLSRVQGYAPSAGFGVVVGVIGAHMCCRGRGVVHLGRGLGCYWGQSACASVAEGAMLCTLGAG